MHSHALDRQEGADPRPYSLITRFVTGCHHRHGVILFDTFYRVNGLVRDTAMSGARIFAESSHGKFLL